MQKERYEGKGFLSFFLTCSAQLVVLSGKGRRHRKGGEGGKENGVGQIPPAHTHTHTHRNTHVHVQAHMHTHINAHSSSKAKWFS